MRENIIEALENKLNARTSVVANMPLHAADAIVDSENKKDSIKKDFDAAGLEDVEFPRLFLNKTFPEQPKPIKNQALRRMHLSESLFEDAEKPESKRARRRPKDICGSLENEVEMRLADEIFTSSQLTPIWPYRHDLYDIETELGVDREDGENGYRVFTVTVPVKDNRLQPAKDIAKEYNLKTEYVAPNNSIGKSNEMLKIYVPMDEPSPFDQKRLAEYENYKKEIEAKRT